MATAPGFDGQQICLQTDPEIFFPELHPDPDNHREGDQSRYKAAVATAKRICSECVHLDPCIEYALYNDVDGIWGGTTKTERRKLRKVKGILTPKSITYVINGLAK